MCSYPNSLSVYVGDIFPQEGRSHGVQGSWAHTGHGSDSAHLLIVFTLRVVFNLWERNIIKCLVLELFIILIIDLSLVFGYTRDSFCFSGINCVKLSRNTVIVQSISAVYTVWNFLKDPSEESEKTAKIHIHDLFLRITYWERSNLKPPREDRDRMGLRTCIRPLC